MTDQVDISKLHYVAADGKTGKKVNDLAVEFAREQGLDAPGCREYSRLLGEAGPEGASLFSAVLALIDDQAVGAAAFHIGYDVLRAAPNLNLSMIYVLPGYRRCGVGRGLMSSIAGLASQNGISTLNWTVPRLDLDTRVFFDVVAPDSFDINMLTYRVELGPA